MQYNACSVGADARHARLLLCPVDKHNCFAPFYTYIENVSVCASVINVSKSINSVDPDRYRHDGPATQVRLH